MNPLAPGARCECCVVRVVPRAPERVALLGARRPREPRSPVPAGDLRDRLRLLLRPRLRAVELDEEHRHLREIGARVAVAGSHLDLVEELDPGHRDAELDRLDHRVDGSLDRLERAGRGRDHLRDAEEPERHLGDHPERPLAADEEPRQVVARRRLPRPAARPDDAAVAENNRQAEDVLAHRPVAHRGRSRRAGRGHAADRRVGARIDGEEEALRGEALREREPGQSGFDAAVEIGAVDLEHPGHAGEIDADPAAQRADMAFERGPGSERDHGNAAAAQAPTTAATSSVDSAKKTASGGADGW